MRAKETAAPRINCQSTIFELFKGHSGKNSEEPSKVSRRERGDALPFAYDADSRNRALLAGQDGFFY